MRDSLKISNDTPRYRRITSRADLYEVETQFENTVLIKYRCPDCGSYQYTNTETISLQYYQRSTLIASGQGRVNIGIIALPLKEILDRFGFSGLFYIGNLSYKGKPLDSFKTFVPQQPRVPYWGGGSSSLIEGCPACGEPDFSIPDSRIYFVEEGYLRKDIDIYAAPASSDLIVSDRVFALIPEPMRRKFYVGKITIINHMEVERLRSEGRVWGPSGKRVPLKTLKEGEYKPLRPLPAPPYRGLPECVRAEGGGKT